MLECLLYSIHMIVVARPSSWPHEVPVSGQEIVQQHFLSLEFCVLKLVPFHKGVLWELPEDIIYTYLQKAWNLKAKVLVHLKSRTDVEQAMRAVEIVEKWLLG